MAIPNEEFPRSTVFWILLAQIVVFLPHIQEVPFWLSFLYFSCLAWRFGIYQGRWDYPNKWVKAFLVSVAFLGVLVSYGNINGAKGGVALLLIAYAFKTLEMSERRDAYISVILAYFVVSCAFLHLKDIVSVAYILLGFAFVTSALISMNHVPRDDIKFDVLTRSGKILLQAVPLMVFLFVFFPKLPPIFQVNLGSEEATTGLSDTVNPGSFSKLTESAQLVFRAEFEKGFPSYSQLYWRAQVFENFDGVQWKIKNKEKSALKHEDIFLQNDGLKANGEGVQTFNYKIFQEPNGQELLFGLAMPWSMSPGVRLNKDDTLTYKTDVNRLISYEVKSNVDYVRGLELSELSRAKNLSLPIYGNERALEYAKDLRESSRSDAEYIERVLSNFQQDFHYTLSPPLLGKNPVDEFLFDTKRGFCGHYASSFAFLMRAAGIPARLIGGYMGGEASINGEYLLIHQFDAHAWNEVWFEGRGWVRIDPTAFVAPERTTRGIEEALSNGESILANNFFSPDTFRRSDPMTNMRLQLDYINLQWDKWILGYDTEKQQELLQKLLGKVNSTRIAIFMLVCFFSVIFLSTLFMYLKDLMRVSDPADRLYFGMLKRLKRNRLIKRPGETPSAFAARLRAEKYEHSEAVDAFTKEYERVKYALSINSPERNQHLKIMRLRLAKI